MTRQYSVSDLSRLRSHTQSKRFENLMRDLTQAYFFKRGFEYNGEEGKSLQETDPHLYKKIVETLKT